MTATDPNYATLSEDKKAALIDEIFSLAAEELGDITTPVITRAYQLCPEGHKAFQTHALTNNLFDLEANMVEQTLYCILDWTRNREASKVAVFSTLPHHIETLEVSLEMFLSPFEALFDVIERVILPSDTLQQTAWQTLRTDFFCFCEEDLSAIA